MRIYLDMDGVITDLTKGVREHFNKPPEWEPKEFKFDYFGDFGCTEDEFWWQLDFEFWENLGFTNDAKGILWSLEPENMMPNAFISPEVRGYMKPIILTSPTRDNAGAKQAWIRKKLTACFEEGRYVITSQKSLLAQRNSILIDDYEKNIEEWEDNGGIGILYPRPWNYLRGVKHPLKHFRRQLRRVMDKGFIYG